MMAGTVTWNLGTIGERQGRVTPDTVAAMEYMHGPFMGTVRRFASGQGSFAETVSIIFATIRIAEGDEAPERSEIQAAVFECGLAEFMATASAVCQMVMGGVRPEGATVN